MGGHVLGGLLAHVPAADGKEDAGEGNLAAIGQAAQEALDGFFLPSLQEGEFGRGQVKEIGRRPDQVQVVELLHGGFTGQDVHGLAAEEVDQLALGLGGAAIGVGAEPLGFAFRLHQGRTAVRTGGRENRLHSARSTFRGLYARNFRDNLATLFHIDPVSQVQVQGAHLVFVDQGGPFDGGAGQEDRFQVGYRRHGSRASYLIVNG